MMLHYMGLGRPELGYTTDHVFNYAIISMWEVSLHEVRTASEQSLSMGKIIVSYVTYVVTAE